MAASDAGFNVLILAFYMSTGVTDFGQAWEAIPSSTKKATMDIIHSRNQIALISFGGSTDNPYYNPSADMGSAVSNWAISNYLDGVDFDLGNRFSGNTDVTRKFRVWIYSTW